MDFFYLVAIVIGLVTLILNADEVHLIFEYPYCKSLPNDGLSIHGLALQLYLVFLFWRRFLSSRTLIDPWCSYPLKANTFFRCRYCYSIIYYHRFELGFLSNKMYSSLTPGVLN